MIAFPFGYFSEGVLHKGYVRFQLLLSSAFLLVAGYASTSPIILCVGL
jgi:hypothetical protein